MTRKVRKLGKFALMWVCGFLTIQAFILLSDTTKNTPPRSSAITKQDIVNDLKLIAKESNNDMVQFKDTYIADDGVINYDVNILANYSQINQDVLASNDEKVKAEFCTIIEILKADDLAMLPQDLHVRANYYSIEGGYVHQVNVKFKHCYESQDDSGFRQVSSDNDNKASLASKTKLGISPPKQENTEAFSHFLECDGGSAHDCTNLGWMYHIGEGVDQDNAKAMSLFRQGCDGGDGIGCSYLGLMYYTGYAVDQDKAKAVSLYRQGCDAGNAPDCTNLGWMYSNGEGVDQDKAKAVSLYRQGCDAGNAPGCTHLGFMYNNGSEVDQNKAKAVSLYRQGCDGGDAKGCSHLGLKYNNGDGVDQDKAKAVSLFRQGCDGGDDAIGCTLLEMLER